MVSLNDALGLKVTCRHRTRGIILEISMSDKETMNWFTVDTDSMSADLKKKWAALKKAQEAARNAKDEFESAFTAAAKKADRIDADVTLAFGYRFGKLAIAKTTEAKPKASAKPKFSF